MSYSLKEMDVIDLDTFTELKTVYNSLNLKRDVKYTLFKDNERVGYVIIRIVTQMNEFKLGNMLIEFTDVEEAEFVDLFNDFLKSQIIDNYMLKITTDINESETNKIELLKKLGFIFDEKGKKTEGFVPLKITKPIFLERS